jgi:hypothetical protein
MISRISDGLTFDGVRCTERSRICRRPKKCVEEAGASLIGEELVSPEFRIALRVIDRATRVIAVKWRHDETNIVFGS